MADLRVKSHGLNPPGELGHDRHQDGVLVGEDPAAHGRGGHAALGHHHADRTARPEWLTAVATYDGGGTSLVR